MQRNKKPPSPIKFLKFKEVIALSGSSRTTLYSRIKEGRYPTSVKNGRDNFWAEHEVDEVNRAILAGKSDEEIRKIVERIHRDRINLGLLLEQEIESLPEKANQLLLEKVGEK